MKKIFFIIIGFILLAPAVAQAQNRYKIDIEVYFSTSGRNMECGTWCDVSLTKKGGSKLPTENFKFEHNVKDGSGYLMTRTIYCDKIIEYVKCNGRHRDNTTSIFTKCKDVSGGSRTTEGGVYESEYPCVDKKFYNFLGKYDNGSYVRIQITPINMALSYSNQGIQVEGMENLNLLSDKGKIKLTASGEYHSSSYRWQYKKVGKDADYSDFPSLLQGSNVLEISGQDIPGFEEAALKNYPIDIRLKYSCNDSKNQTLTPMLSAPGIINIKPLKPTCPGLPTGKLLIDIDRKLYSGEFLNVTLYEYNGNVVNANGENIAQGNIKKISDTQFEASGVSSGMYDVKIASYYLNEQDPLYIDDTETYRKKKIKIEEPSYIKIEDIEPKGPVCSSGTGGIWLLMSGGAGLYNIKCVSDEGEFLFEKRPNMTTVDGLPAGEYEVHVTDTNNCQAIGIYRMATISAPASELELETDYTQATFDEYEQEENNGSVIATVKQGTPPYRFIWKENDENGTVLSTQDVEHTNPEGKYVSVLNGINSGTYYVLVEDKDGCNTISEIIEVTQAPKIIIDVTQTNVIACAGGNDGELTADADNGIFPYTYEWYKIINYSSKIHVGSGPVLSGMYAGTYKVLVEDSQGSKAWSKNFVLADQNPISIGFSVGNLICSDDNDGYIQASVSGGTPPYSYSWSSGDMSDRAENLSLGSYTLWVTDSQNCTAEKTGSVGAPGAMQVQSTVTDPSCYGSNNGKIQLHVSGSSGPYTYTWSNGETTSMIDHLSPGSYDVTVEDGNQCGAITEYFNLDEPDPVYAAVEDVVTVSEFGKSDGSFNVVVEGGSQPYQVSCIKDGATPVHAQKVTDQNDGSFLYEFNSLEMGDYTIEIKDKKYQSGPDFETCKQDLEVTITEPGKMAVNIEEIQSVSCHNGSNGILVAHGEGGEPDNPVPYIYEWYSVYGATKTLLACTDSVITDLPAGNYQVQITDLVDASVWSPVFNIQHPDSLELSFIVNDLTCEKANNGSVQVLTKGGSGGYSYQWSSGETSYLIQNKSHGTYSVIVTDSKGCKITDSATIVSPNTMYIAYSLVPMTCYGHNDGFIDIEVTGGLSPYSYAWSNGSTEGTQENLAAGSYTLTITDDNQCKSDTTFIIPEIKPIEVKLRNLTQPKAFGYSDGSITMEIAGGNQPYQIFWTNENNELMDADTLVYEDGKAISVLKNIPEGSYYLRIEDANYWMVKDSFPEGICGCSRQLPYYMPQPPKLIATITQTHFIPCFESNNAGIRSTTTGGVPFEEGLPYVFEWYKDGELFADGATELAGLSVGSYRLKITDANDIETWSQTIQVTQPDLVKLSFQSADIKCSKDTDGWAEVAVVGGTPPYLYEWSTGATGTRIENVSRGKYFVWVRDKNNCEVTGNVAIIQADSIQVTAKVTDPTCYNGGDGKIEISLSGGEAPYTYHWENNQQSLSRNNLRAGAYTFTVTDAHQCGFEEITYQLSHPDSIVVNLGEDRVLCKGQSLTLTPEISETIQSYSWYNPQNNKIGSGASCTLSDGGKHRIDVVTSKGCKGSGTITITRDNREIASDFVVASRVPIHGEVIMVNITEPAPESCEWILPENTDGITITNQNEHVLEVVFDKYGQFTIGMRSHSGPCWETVYKTVTVMDKQDIEEYVEPDEPMLKRFTASPNPADDGAFTVDIELKEKSPVQLNLIHSGSGKLYEQKLLDGNKIYKERFDMKSIAPGTYILNLLSPKAKSVLKVVID